MRLPRNSASSWRLVARPIKVPQTKLLWRPPSALGRAYATHPTLDLPAIDQKWQRRWQEQAAADSTRLRVPDKSKAYILAMFPYPSGALHMGHLRNYAVADVLARFRHMQGHDVVYPMGWDAFGLPAENAAIERGIHPAQWTKENTAKMKAQLQAMNGGMDWSREFMTCDPEFYKHTQRLFLLLHRHGLAYQAESLVNYDPIDRTVLANEQVDANGNSWRSGVKVEQVMLRQWFLKITDFRESLLNDLDFLGQHEKWPERVLAMQRHWLGRSEGATIKFGIKNDVQTYNTEQFISIFTTRPDTLFGAQYLAVSASHPLVTAQMQQSTELSAFVEAISSMPTDSKAGFQLPGVYGTNPLSRVESVDESLHQPLPIFVAPYVLDGYGSGAVMGVPGHDVRDFEFWKQNRPNEPIRLTIVPKRGVVSEVSSSTNEPYTDLGYLSAHCKPFDELASKDAMECIVSTLSKSDLASQSETWRLRDWLISRQRYWGTPIPIIHCRSCGPVPVPEEELPVELPPMDGAGFKSRTGNPLEAAEDWVNVLCPKCGSAAKRDTDTMDTFMDSSWYFFRFVDPHNTNSLFDPEKVNRTMPVDVYIGGIEHAILHLLYARFISKFLAKISVWPSGNDPNVRGEPFQKLISQGMVHGKTYSDPENGRFLKPEELDFTDPNEPKIIRTGGKPNISFEKMSKSKYNGVDPSSFMTKYGADVTRAHILFQAPVTDVLEWEEDRIVGIQRWFQRVWRLIDHSCALQLDEDQPKDARRGPETYNSSERALHNAIHTTISSITTSLSQTYSLNTCISDLMQFTNQILDVLDVEPNNSKQPIRSTLIDEATRTLVCLLAPFAPAFTSECWERIVSDLSRVTKEGHSARFDVFDEPFPTTSSDAYLEPDAQTCVVMENGRKRFETTIPVPPRSLAEAELQSWVLEELRKSSEGKAWFERKGYLWDRVVVVKSAKTVNFVGNR